MRSPGPRSIGYIGISGPAIGRVVLKAAVFRRIVRGRNHDAVCKVSFAAAIVNQNRPRNDRCWSYSVVLLNGSFDAIGRQDLQSGPLSGIRQGVRVLAHEQSAVYALSNPVIANGLSDCQDVRFGEI